MRAQQYAAPSSAPPRAAPVFDYSTASTALHHPPTAPPALITRIIRPYDMPGQSDSDVFRLAQREQEARAAREVGPGRYACSPCHRMPFTSRHEGS
jgi:hypothetical protein